MENILLLLKQNLEAVYAIIGLLTSVIIAAILAYKKIRDAIYNDNAEQLKAQDEANHAKAELTNIVKGAITTIEENPAKILNALGKANSKLDMANPHIKAEIVQKLVTSKHVDLLNKISSGTKEVVNVATFVSNVYQGIKPLIHLIRINKK